MQIANKLRSVLREYYPVFLDAFDDLSSKEARATLHLAPTPASGHVVRKASLTAALRRAGRTRSLWSLRRVAVGGTDPQDPQLGLHGNRCAVQLAYSTVQWAPKVHWRAIRSSRAGPFRAATGSSDAEEFGPHGASGTIPKLTGRVRFPSLAPTKDSDVC